MRSSNSLLKSTKRLTVAAMLAAISIVVGMICKNYLNFDGGLFRITFENLPIIAAGIILGPAAGGAVGLCADVVSYCLSTQSFAISPIVTLGAVAVGVCSGVMARYVVRRQGVWQVILAGGVAHIVGSMIIKTVGLFSYYGWAVLVRIPLYIVIATVEIALLCAVLKNPAIKKLRAEMSGDSCPCKKNETMSYDEALEYIHSVSWKGSRPGLERTRELLGKMGDPHKKLKFIHVAGTNGKGSFCAMTESVLRHAGYKVGLYTSPYVLRFNERMKVDGEDIPDARLAEITRYVKPFAESMRDLPTEFELITAIALEYFAREECDVVVLECGMGGRLDSTNIIDTPILSVITGIALDHTEFLGDTVEKIAEEKAGIIKDGVPVLLCSDKCEAMSVISRVASERGAVLNVVNRSSLEIKSMTLDGTLFDFGNYTDIRLSLLGGYQPHNACNVLTALEILRGQGMIIPDEAVYGGLSSTVWHARFELLCERPTVISDGGHNPEGIDAAVDSIKTYFPDKKVIFVTGVMADKDFAYMARKMSEVAAHAFCVRPDNPRALSAEEYCRVFESLGVCAQPSGSVDDAVAAACAKAQDEDIPVICLGSLYMYGEVRAALSRVEGLFKEKSSCNN